MVSSSKRLPSESEGGKIVKFLSVSFVALCSMQSSSKRVAVFDLGMVPKVFNKDIQESSKA